MKIENEKIINYHEKISPSEEEQAEKKTNCTTVVKKSFYQDLEQMKKYIKEKTPSIFKENFELLKYVSSGSVGTFYEGKCLKGSKQKIGMKFSMGQQNEKERKKIEKNQEILILKKLHQKNIISLYGNYKLDEYSSCAIMELAKYGDLDNFQRKLLKRKCLPETLINYLAKQILDGLKYIHENKVLHMDIKQDNILIDSNLNVKITDFSVSSSYTKFKDEDIVILPFAGTTKFICPEILGRKNVTIKDCSKIDLYSLGIVLYYLTYGTYPYDLKSIHGKDYKEIEKKILENRLEFPENRKLSNSYIDFLKGLLNKDIDKRLNIDKALDHRWIKGSIYIFEEKEKVVCLEKFLINLITDSIPLFNDYLEKIDKTSR